MQHRIASIAPSRAWQAGRSREPNCRFCRAPVRHIFAELGMAPRCTSLLTSGQLHQPEVYYPLTVLVCDRCFLVQLPEGSCLGPIPHQHWPLAVARSAEDAQAYGEMIQTRLRLGPKSLVVDLASQGGRRLRHFLPLGIPVLGIEPAAGAAEATSRRDVPTSIGNFGTSLAEQLVRDGKRADLIIAVDALERAPDLNDFVAGMKLLLARGGVAALEIPHLQRVMEENQIDALCQEHLSYFSLLTIDRLAESHGLEVVDVEKLAAGGGSLRVYLAHAGSPRRPTSRVSAMLEEEIDGSLLDIHAYTRFAEKALTSKHKLLAFLIGCKGEGKRICGYGAAARASALLNYCGIGADLLDFTVDRNPFNYGRFTPGTHIPVLPVEAIDDAKPDYILILDRDLGEEAVSKLHHVGGWGGRIVASLPEVRLIEPGRGA